MGETLPMSAYNQNRENRDQAAAAAAPVQNKNPDLIKSIAARRKEKANQRHVTKTGSMENNKQAREYVPPHQRKPSKVEKTETDNNNSEHFMGAVAPVQHQRTNSLKNLLDGRNSNSSRRGSDKS